ncbi:MAG TPA: hypothetical protein VFE38_17115 [Edaphobacter sp.]|nr:hypothetical protein [Edaphobacter sp.]
MRRFLSISLVLLFVLPLVSPLFAASAAEANLPACCRRNGKHHCTMLSVEKQSADRSPAVHSPSLREKCPYNLSSAAATHLPFVPDEIQMTIYAGILSHPACHAQTEARFRISFDRSQQKRGPPQLLLFHS